MDFINLEVTDFIGTVTLNKPPVNSFNIQMYQELIATMQEIENSDDVRIVIIRAEGNIFSAGNEVEEFLSESISNEEDALNYGKTVSDAMAAVYNCRVPVIAAVNGAAYGSGMALAAVCDIIVASENAKFGIPEIKVGITGASGFFGLLVPEKVVRYKAFTGGSLTAEEMKQFGAVQKVVPKGETHDAALEIVNELLRQGPIALQNFKKAMHRIADARLAEKYSIELGYSKKYIHTYDFKEAVSSYLEKRNPVFKGQ